MSSSEYTDAVLLFGDSLTETWAAGSLAQRMAELYQGRLDVVNRGFSGANDACLPGELQHVPLDQYKANLSRLISHVRSHSPETKIVVINPPPIMVDLWHKWLRHNVPLAHIPNRDAEVSKQYSDACKEVAGEEDLPLADVYAAITGAAGGSSEELLAPYLSDGLHLTDQGNKIAFDTVRNTIASTYPELDPLNMATRMPAFNATPNGYPVYTPQAGPSGYYGRPALPIPSPLSHQHPIIEPIPEPTPKAGYEAPVFRTFQDRKRAREVTASTPTAPFGYPAMLHTFNHSHPHPHPSLPHAARGPPDSTVDVHPHTLRSATQPPYAIPSPDPPSLPRAHTLPNPPLRPQSTFSRPLPSPLPSTPQPTIIQATLERSDTVSSVKSLDRMAFGSRRPLPKPPVGVNSSKSLDRGLPLTAARARKQPSIVDEEDEDAIPSITVDIDTQSPAESTALPTFDFPDVEVENHVTSGVAISQLPVIAINESSTAPPTSRLDPSSAIICAGCDLSIIGRIVNAIQQRWHPQCFKCHECGELLEHVSSYEWQGKPYCHLDYHDKFAHRCFHCKTPIVDVRFVTLDDPVLGERYYHELHFFCSECGDPFLDPSQSSAPGAHASDDETNAFVIHNGHPYCERCHLRLHKPKCRACSKPIPEVAAEAMGSKWHKECFVCVTCGNEFANNLFFPKDGQAFCTSCYEQML
ncbi:hypothetical protein BCR39DRAFT_469152 [Naematelia encephala]|uniref:LIM zinc-binding domain-containing protein n=1 Tax=Naematelia encephala TaxID=71784 RepID=A0A1Y2AZF2_9TREE|nr:hypothetical protein BCR39DRAFT_469152 [Naematelia encephala]